MGIPFPLGLLRFEERDGATLVAWGLGVNGFMGVLGSLVAVPLAMVFGFRVVLLGATAIYVLAALELRARGHAEPRRPPEGARRPRRWHHGPPAMASDPERQARAAAILLEADESSTDYALEDAMSPLWGLWLQRSNVVRSVLLKKPGGGTEQLGKAHRSWWVPRFVHRARHLLVHRQ